VPVPDVLRFERELLEFLGRTTTVLSTLRETNVLTDDTVALMSTEIDKFKQEFQTGEGKPLASVGKETFAAIKPEEVNQEKIVKHRR